MDARRRRTRLGVVAARDARGGRSDGPTRDARDLPAHGASQWSVPPPSCGRTSSARVAAGKRGRTSENVRRSARGAVARVSERPRKPWKVDPIVAFAGSSRDVPENCISSISSSTALVPFTVPTPSALDTPRSIAARRPAGRTWCHGQAVRHRSQRDAGGRNQILTLGASLFHHHADVVSKKNHLLKDTFKSHEAGAPSSTPAAAPPFRVSRWTPPPLLPRTISPR